jgi:hypothetical protein
MRPYATKAGGLPLILYTEGLLALTLAGDAARAFHKYEALRY